MHGRRRLEQEAGRPHHLTMQETESEDWNKAINSQSSLQEGSAPEASLLSSNTSMVWGPGVKYKSLWGIFLM